MSALAHWLLGSPVEGTVTLCLAFPGFLLLLVPGCPTIGGSLNSAYIFVNSPFTKLPSVKSFEDVFPGRALTDTSTYSIFSEQSPVFSYCLVFCVPEILHCTLLQKILRTSVAGWGSCLPLWNGVGWDWERVCGTNCVLAFTQSSLI